MLLMQCATIVVKDQNQMSIKTYSELIRLPTFEERFQYLKLDGKVGEETFGSRRYLNQEFYHSREWLSFRDSIIIRDDGCDLALEGFNIFGSVLIHHLNPITFEDILNRSHCIFDPENVVCTKKITHDAIHYGDENLLIVSPHERQKNDTCPWRQTK